MKVAIGLDIGGTKIAGAAFDALGHEITRITEDTPKTYGSFLEICASIVEQLEQKSTPVQTLGIGLPGSIDSTTGIVNNAANIAYLSGQPLAADLKIRLKRAVRIENDANCAALAEAMEGAGQSYRSVFGMIMGTGIGAGLVINGQILSGANGLCGEIGHLPLPFYEASDGEQVACGCGQKGCIEKLIAGGALARLFLARTGRVADAKQIAEWAQAGDAEALSVLDGYYTTAAKAMAAIIHSFDPDIITVSGGLNALPGLYDEIPKRWGRYTLCKNPKTKFVSARFGALAGLRGAAWVGRHMS